MRGDATAQGGYQVTKELVNNFLPNKKDIKVVVQGFRQCRPVYDREKLFDDGFKIIAVSDSQGGIYNSNGLNIKDLINFKKSGESVAKYREGEIITNSKLLELETDILVLAALENQITSENAQRIQANYIVELANGPITYDADKILASNNKIIVPDILANSGGVIVSYFEWAQNRTGQILEEEYLRNLLEKKMINNWQRVYDQFTSYQGKITLRQSPILSRLKES